jgi:hypothetical protein
MKSAGQCFLTPLALTGVKQEKEKVYHKRKRLPLSIASIERLVGPFDCDIRALYAAAGFANG